MRAVIPLLLLLLSGCGFTLRHNQHYLGTKYPQVLLPPTGSHTLHQALHRALLASHIEVLDSAPLDKVVPSLLVVNQDLTSLPLVYGPDAELRRERLKMSVNLSLSDPQTRNFTLYTERDRQLNPRQHLGDNAEKIIIEQEMQADIIEQLLRFLASERASS